MTRRFFTLNVFTETALRGNPLAIVNLARILFGVLLGIAVGDRDAIAPAVAQDKSVLTYHGDVARTGTFVVPGLTWERAGALHLDTAFHASFSGHVYAQRVRVNRSYCIAMKLGKGGGGSDDKSADGT